MPEEEKNTEVIDNQPDVDDDEVKEEDFTEDSSDEVHSKKQTREENKRYAELRRQHEAEKKELEEENRILKQKLKSSSQSSLSDEELEDLGISKVETDEELFLVEAYNKAKYDGNAHPSTAAYRALMNRNKEAKTKQQEQTLINKDIDECSKKFGKMPTEILNDKGFNELFGDAVKHGELASYYDRYLKIVGAEKNISEEQKKRATPPPVNPGAKPTNYSELSEKDRLEILRNEGYI